MKKAALYARVSTTEQANSLASQLEQLRGYATARGFEPVECVDHGVSGAQAQRAALDAMLLAARARKIDMIVCTKLDRLFRSVRHLVTLVAELEALKVDLIVIDQGVDTTTSSGRLLFHVLAAIAEFERDLIRERVVVGLAGARARGVRLGRPPLPGISADYVADLRSKGLGFRAIATHLSKVLNRKVHKNTVRGVWRDIQRLMQANRAPG